MRWDTLQSLLLITKNEKNERQDPSSSQTATDVVMVEVGVWLAQLSRIMFECEQWTDDLIYIGVDPYIGGDGTFPPELEQLDPVEVRQHAQAVFDEIGGKRAHLWVSSSADAARDIPLGSVDIVSLY